MKVTDGPNGARGAQGSMGPSSACFPSGIALGATWNPELVEQVGQALGEDTRTKDADILLAPTVNIQRSPLSGRNFEFYSEDPYLTSRMAVAYINGLQSRGVGACIKHFVCNDSEFERNSMSSEVGERPLREIYLRPFETAIREAAPWAVMSSYNKINGTWASENDSLLRGILKGEWGFEGIVMSDWMGTYTAAVPGGGLDLEMPGPGRWMGATALEAVCSGAVGEVIIDDKVRRMLRTLVKAGRFERPQFQPEQAVDRPEHRAIARQAAGEAIVLLKNEGGTTLPLRAANLKSIAVIGSHAAHPQVLGGGSTFVTPHTMVTPLEAIRQRVGPGVEVGYALGCPLHKLTPLLDMGLLEAGSLRLELFDNLTLSGEPAETTVVQRSAIEWTDALLTKVDRHKFSARLTASFMAPESGCYTFGLEGSGQSRLLVEDGLVVDCWSDRTSHSRPRPNEEKRGELELKAGQSATLRVEFALESSFPWRRLRIGCTSPLPADPICEAVTLAKRSEVAIVFAGLTAEWESEGFDRPDLELRGAQVELIERVAAANPHTIVVLTTGSPVRMPWLDKVPAVLQTWFAGQEAGPAAADVLFGDRCPSGKLPQTFPQRLQDNPATLNYPGENGKVLYGEGLFVGYRYYDKKEIAPLFPFGYGLSYTSFAYRALTLDADAFHPGQPVGFNLEVENTGPVAGQEVVQVYLRDVRSRLVRPEQELKAFTKVALAPGERTIVRFSLDERALSYYDPSVPGWVAEPGVFELRVGASSRDIRLVGQFELMSQ